MYIYRPQQLEKSPPRQPFQQCPTSPPWDVLMCFFGCRGWGPLTSVLAQLLPEALGVDVGVGSNDEGNGCWAPYPGGLGISTIYMGLGDFHQFPNVWVGWMLEVPSVWTLFPIFECWVGLDVIFDVISWTSLYFCSWDSVSPKNKPRTIAPLPPKKHVFSHESWWVITLVCDSQKKGYLTSRIQEQQKKTYKWKKRTPVVWKLTFVC